MAAGPPPSRPPRRALVTVRLAGESRGRDLELPAEIPARELAALVARALGWDGAERGPPVAHRIAAGPSGRLLEPEETLADAGLWDGSCLVFHPVAE